MKKKVVILSTFLSPFRSGAEACAEEIAVALSSQFDITLVTARLRRDLSARDTLQERVPVVRVGLGYPIDKWLFPFLAPFAVAGIKPDIVHAVLESYAGLAMVLCKFTSRAKRLLTCQSTNTTFLVRLMHRTAHRITVISSVLLKRAQIFGRRDALLIPNGLHCNAVPTRERIAGRLLFVGRLEHVKGVDTLLYALTLLPSHVHLRIVGDGKKRSNLQILANRLHIRDRVDFLGYIPVPAVYDEYARAEIFCGLSRSEALGNVFLEAQAAGCAVVAARTGGIPDIVQHEVTGLLVPPNNPQAAAGAIGMLLNDDALRGRLSAAGKLNAAQYDWSAIAPRYAKIYETL
jgi:glycosyltransferase involved in cell wall biosynthesis